MAFPSIRPTSRSFDAGDYPVKVFKSQSGAEVRILYGDKRTNMKMQLGYENITDAQAELFLDHYNETQGTFQTFAFENGTQNAKLGWEGSDDAIGAQYWGNNWRYEGPPQVQQVRSGISTVTVNLIGVL
jgi:hypothetical protein